jgi:hypothetical protein
MNKEDKKYERPEAYPKPSVTDEQLNGQPEFIDQQPNDFRDKSVSDIPATDADVEQANDPRKESSGE